MVSKTKKHKASKKQNEIKQHRVQNEIQTAISWQDNLCQYHTLQM